METIKSIAHTTMTALSLLTAVGVFMHDGRVDKAAMTALDQPFRVAEIGTTAQKFQKFIQTDAHTHPDHNAANSALMKSFKYQSPSIPPRKDDRDRRVLATIEQGGRHAFDNITLPVIA